MSIRSPRRVLPALACSLLVLAGACGGGSGNGGEEELLVRDVPPGGAVQVFQLDFPHPQGDYLDSSWGLLLIDPGALAQATGIRRGFLNVAMGDRWVGVNVPVLGPGEQPYSVCFDLGLDQQTKLVDARLYVKHSSRGLGGFAEHRGQDAVHLVERRAFDAEQFTPAADPGTLPTARLVTDRVAPPTDVTTVTQMVTNVQCAHNQCMSMAVANALQYLDDMGQTTLAHDHVPGLLGDDTLVGLLDEYSARSATSREVGGGLSVTAMVEGAFEYISIEGLSADLVFRHQNDGVGWTTLGTGSGTYSAHGIDSFDDGGTITHGWLYDRLAGGCGVVLVYIRDGGGGHAGRITAAGFDDTGRRWIRFTHDVQQSDSDPTDSRGLTHWLSDWGDTDADGTPNFLTDGREIRFVWAQIPN